MTEDEQLNGILASAEERLLQAIFGENKNQSSAPTSARSGDTTEFQQWNIGPNDLFMPAGATVDKLPCGVFEFGVDDYGRINITLVKVITDSLVELPDSASERVLSGMDTFWKMEDRYRKHGLLYKRGIILWGPPGGGKTATLTLLSKNLIDAGGLIVICNHPEITSRGLAILRKIEKKRRIICILEDIDEIIQKHGEHDLLALLDGENQVDSIVNIATTNYPDRLGARIVNRPSRFDERIMVGMPSAEARRAYLNHTVGSEPGLDLEKWVKDTDQLSIAHLRELTAAVLCLDQKYDVVLERLKSMRYRPKERDEISDAPVGFNHSTGTRLANGRA